jgi:Domain of unknown function (4846)
MESFALPLFAETFQKYQLMRLETAMVIILPFFASCQESKPNYQAQQKLVEQNINPFLTISAIPLPQGYERVKAEPNSFANWLRALPLKKNKTVYIYNGTPKKNQTAQFAVIDISVGNKDLQQCADAVMRLRAEYLYHQYRYSEIDFSDNNRLHYRLSVNANHNEFKQYLQRVFSYCGTLSLNNQLKEVINFSQIKAGDVLIKGGSPGHAMLVVDVAANKNGEKIYLLAQSYMPAQDIHVVINPADKRLTPWYSVASNPLVETPEWVFKTSQLKKWPE